MIKRIATFSLVAHDPEAEEWGVAVASKFLAVGSVVPWANAKVGAVATQAFANLTFGPRGLELLSAGKSAKEVVDELVAADMGAEHRQLGVVDGSGAAATFTGDECLHWAGGVTGENFACQGNILTGPEVVDSIAETFTSTTGTLTDRLLEALYAGDRAGGDSRGRQSAAILVAREAGGYGGANDRAVDLRVDDHPDPVVELKRLRTIHRLLLESPKPEDIIDIDSNVASEIQSVLAAHNALSGSSPGAYDEATSNALRTFMGIENLEMRWVDGPRIDKAVLEYLRAKRSSG